MFDTKFKHNRAVRKMNDFGDTKENDNQENQDAEAQEDTDPSYQTLSRSKSFCVLSICS